ncbi:hypothetical protein ABOM_001782 [Aspergillus bombycis]|uniref:ML-like domain-containing protein n=1 Tax=Aspergillus bombycis TaxID=109264 RepID=A0A1F8AE96_9EURO|nr:hypothetical protein ABOM_001782 [Aspergillus bombycis]OGM49675.1 hypothetical protein ABOM_001782 [Aspergillus bombycis]
MPVRRRLSRGILGVLYAAQFIQALQILESTALVPCSDDSVINTNLFKMALTPGNNSVMIEFDGEITFSGMVMLDVDVLAYGYSFLTMRIDLCDYDLSGFCPMISQNLTVPSAVLTLSDDIISGIPGIAYTFPDLDAVVRVNMISNSTNTSVTCVEASVVNSSTVYQAAVGWTLAVITGLGLFASIILSVLGYLSISTQISFRTALLLSFMQSQAMVGLTAMEFKPMIQNWTQDFQWTMSIVHTDFLDTITTWFQRSTGGTPSTLRSEAGTISIGLLKRSDEVLVGRSMSASASGAEVLLRGIIRMGYRAGLESTNIFMTGHLVFHFIAIVMLLALIALKFGLSAFLKKTQGKRSGYSLAPLADWQQFMRGGLGRIAYLGYPQICVFGMWEIYQQDSAAEILLAITLWLATTVILGHATFRVLQHARATKGLNETLACSLHFDSRCMAQWGYLYAHYRAHAFYFIIPLLLYTFLKGITIAFAQQNPLAQAIVLLILEAGFLIGTAIVRPYVDKKANAFAIAAAAINLANAIFCLIFTNIFDQPDLMTGIVALLFFFLNAIFTLVLVIFLLIGLFYACRLKDPTADSWRSYHNRISLQSMRRLLRRESRQTLELVPLTEGTTSTKSHRQQRPNSPSS